MKQEITKNELVEMYDNMLDDSYDIFKIGYLEFYASDILKQCDAVAYRCGLNDFYDSISDDYYCEGME